MKMKCVWWWHWEEDATLAITGGGLGCGQGKLQDMRALPGVLQGKARLCPHRDHMLLSGLLCPSGARAGDSRATGCWEGMGMPPGCPRTATVSGSSTWYPALSQSAGTIPASRSGAGAEKSCIPPLPPAQSCSPPFPEPFHPFSLITIQPYSCSSCNRSCSGKNKGKNFPTSGRSLHLRGPGFRAAQLPRATASTQSRGTCPGSTRSV